jgi:hypothetical protein
MYVGNGIAYGSLVGLRGRERDLVELGNRAGRGLALAAICEAAAIGICSWALMPLHIPNWARVGVAMFLAAIADLFTFALIRGL